MKRNQRGFTLMELMVVIVIVAILAAVAVPLYLNYVKDAQRTEAKGAMGAIITAEQATFQKESVYKAGAASADVEATLGIDLGEAKANWVFTVSVTGQVGQEGFIITATPISGRPTKDVGPVTYTYSRNNPTPPQSPWSP